MNNIVKNTKAYVNSQLTFSQQYPENTKDYHHNAYGAVQLAILCVDIKTAIELEKWWSEEVTPLFLQNY